MKNIIKILGIGVLALGGFLLVKRANAGTSTTTKIPPIPAPSETSNVPVTTDETGTDYFPSDMNTDVLTDTIKKVVPKNTTPVPQEGEINFDYGGTIKDNFPLKFGSRGANTLKLNTYLNNIISYDKNGKPVWKPAWDNKTTALLQTLFNDSKKTSVTQEEFNRMLTTGDLRPNQKSNDGKGKVAIALKASTISYSTPQISGNFFKIFKQNEKIGTVNGSEGNFYVITYTDAAKGMYGKNIYISKSDVKLY